MALTYEAIATVTVGSGGAADITFSSIPGTYTDLLVKLSGRSGRAAVVDYLDLQFNGSTGANYNWRNLVAYAGTVVESQTGSNQTYMTCGYVNGANSTTSTFSNVEIYIPNYTSSNNKSLSADAVLENNSASANELGIIAGLWAQTSAITSIKLYARFANFSQYSTATLYGIKATV